MLASPALRTFAAALWGAACMILAFPTIDLAFPALLAWTPLLLVARRLSWKRRLLAGWLMGFAYQLVLFRWVSFTLDVMTNLPEWVGMLAAVIFAVWHGLMCGVFLALAEPARKAGEARFRGGGILAVAAVYLAVEWVWPFLFPWTLGHAFWQVPPIAAAMALTGPAGLSWVLMALAAGAADVWVARERRPVWIALAASLPILLFGVAWYAHVESVEPRKTLRVAILQPNYSLEEKRNPSPAMRMEFLRRVTAQIRSLPAGRFDLIVASEGAFPLLWRLDADTATVPPGRRPPIDLTGTRVIQRAVATGPATHAIIGGLRRDADGHIRNAAVHLGPDGRILGHYDKNLLVPFGEYMPGRDIFPDLATAVKGISNFYPGEGPCQFDVGGEAVTCGICYETIFADYHWRGVGEASLLVNLTIDTWFGFSTAPWFHLMAQSSRAIELGIPMVRSSLTGVSTWIGPDGQLREQIGLNQTGVLDVTIPLADLSPPFRAVGPLFRWLAIALAVLALIDAWWRRRSVKRSERSAEPAADTPTGRSRPAS